MGRRFTICLAALIVLTMGSIGALWFATRPTHRINETTVEQIKIGMTLVEVESILGVREGDYSTHNVAVVVDLTRTTELYKNPPKSWWTNELVMDVNFDDNGRVEGVLKRQAFVFERHPSWWTKFRRWSRFE